MLDKSSLFTFAALILLVVAVTSFDGHILNTGAIGDTLFWILGGLLFFRLIRGGCCGSACGRSDQVVVDNDAPQATDA